MSEGISAQGTILSMSVDPQFPDFDPVGGPVAYTEIAELGDLTPPPITRNAIETTTHNQSDSRFIVGIRRKGEVAVTLNFIPQDPTHILLKESIDNGDRQIFKIEFPEGSGLVFSGYLTGLNISAPVDDKLTADLTIQPTGAHAWFLPA